MNAEFLQTLMNQQSMMFKNIMEETQARRNDSYPEERRFRDMEAFEGKEEKYKEWAAKITVEELSAEMNDLVKRAEETADETDIADTEEKKVKFGTILHSV